MADDPEAPRKIYQLRPREFERLNATRGDEASPQDEQTAASPSDAGAGKIDVLDLARAATPAGPLLTRSPGAIGENEVQAMLRQNLERDRAAGLFDVSARVDLKRRRRAQTFWLTLLLVDGAAGLAAWRLGPGNPLPFAGLAGGAGAFTAVLIWRTWFLRTE